jgi:phenylpyruvate tautomerase PptA (4-oxalocrotonate tautomerase family)
MPYLRITCPEGRSEQRQRIAQHLTAAINDLFYHPRGRVTRAELRERTTVHFMPYAPGDLFIGGRTPDERGAVDLTVELSDWHMSVRQQRKVARVLTPVLADLFDVPPNGLDGINIRFHPYPPRDFAVGGRLLSDLVPRVGRLMKRLAG